MIGVSDIMAGYWWILGRIPASSEIDAFQARFDAAREDQVQAFQRELLRSVEFRNRRLHLQQWVHFTAYELNRSRLAFVHIEKCGGTTLHAMLADQFGNDRICPERHDGLGNWTVNELASYDLFSGHFDLAACRSIPGDVRIVTMLREPKSRLLSLFHFWKSHLPDPDRDRHDLMGLVREHSAEGFFAHPIVVGHPSIRNAMAAQLTRTRNKTPVRPDDPMMIDPAAVLDLAWTNLQDLAGFGLVERFEESRLLLNETLGLQMQAIRPRQVLAELVVSTSDMSAVAPATMSDRLDRLLDELTGIDQALYAKAQQLFEQRVALMGSGNTPALPNRPIGSRPSVGRRVVAGYRSIVRRIAQPAR